jgi:predicted O-methyltransferase YrrM
MQFAEIQRFLDSIPYNVEMRVASTVPERGRVLYEHIRRQKPLSVLELGIGFGVGSCYMAAALEENHLGHLTGVDLVDAAYSPSAEELVSQANLASSVSFYREQVSYTWFLKKRLEQRTNSEGFCEPEFDLCFIDGSKDWTIEGAAFFMVDKLLKEGGWIIFDDYDWIRDSQSPRQQSGDHSKSLEEDSQSHVEAIFRLLVTQHPSYGDFQIDGNRWAWARKIHSKKQAAVRLTYTPSFRYTMSRRIRTFYRGLKKTSGPEQRSQVARQVSTTR